MGPVFSSFLIPDPDPAFFGEGETMIYVATINRNKFAA